MMKRIFFFISLGLSVVGGALAQPVNVLPIAETNSAPHNDIDDPAIWVNPNDVSKSFIVACENNSSGGILLFDLDGKLDTFIAEGHINSVDVKYCHGIQGQDYDIIVGTNQSTPKKLSIFSIDANANIKNVTGLTDLPYTPYGIGLYKSPTSKKLYAFVSEDNTAGNVFQYELYENEDSLIDINLVRNFTVGGRSEGIVADDDLGNVFIAEEDSAIWKYGAEPTDDSIRVMIDNLGPNITSDIEGLALYRGPDSTGYIIASSQGSSTFSVYERSGQHNFVMDFKIIDNDSVDEVSATDGIDVISTPLPPLFPNGVFLAHDADNPGTTTNIKMVPWEGIADSASLMKYTQWDPRHYCQPNSVFEQEIDATGILLYPNPAHNFIQVELFGDFHNGTMRLNNSLGQVVFEEKIQQRSQRINLSEFAPGIYFIQCFSFGGDLTFSAKFIRE